MRKLTLLAGSGMLVACSVLQAPGLQDGPLMELERACIETPGDAWAWQRLGEHLLAHGELERALRMLKQASSLREYALMDDYATLRAASTASTASTDSTDSNVSTLSAPGAAGGASAPAGAGWPAGMPRTELRPLGPALLELRRVESDTQATKPALASLATRLEISNGNGVPGLAAAWGRSLQGGELAVIRLSNIKPYMEPASRIEYSAASAERALKLAGRIGVRAVQSTPEARRGSPDLRLVLGSDLRTALK